MSTTESDLDTRSRILDAAEKAFADGGLAGARVAAIAEAAGANKAMLYYYFDSKEALYFAVLERVMEQIGSVVAQVGVDPTLPAAEAIRRLVTGYQGVLTAHPDFVRLVLRGLLDHRDEIVAFVVPRVAPYAPIALERVRQAQREGLINGDIVPMLTPPVIVAPLLMFALMHPVVARLSGLPVDVLTEQFRENALQIYLNGLLPREDR
jgi:TetR/AcrR family transcriptional regulator